MTRKKKILVFGGLGAVVVILVALNATAQRDRGQAVRMGAVERRDLVATVTASGQIEPQRSVDVSADITGRIIEIPVEEGDFVHRGDPSFTRPHNTTTRHLRGVQQTLNGTQNILPAVLRVVNRRWGRCLRGRSGGLVYRRRRV